MRTYICEFPLYFPFFFTPSRILTKGRTVFAVRQLESVREIQL